MSKYRRKPKGKKINPTIFVFCEGETEEAYINLLKSYFRLSSIQIHPRIKGNNITSNYIKSYKKDKPTHKKDINYLMYDLDAPKILNRIKKIKDCVLLVSNPCIELWFLLHFHNYSAENTCRQLNKELSSHNKAYKKGEIDNKLKNILTNEFDNAIKRAKKMKNFNNPSTTVYKLLEKLIELKSS